MIMGEHYLGVVWSTKYLPGWSPAMGRFNIATEEEIKSGLTSDIYYLNTKDVLKAKGVNDNVAAEITVGWLPLKWGWGVFCGLEEVIHLYEGLPVDIFALREGTIFPP